MSDVDLGHWTLAEGIAFQADAFGFIYAIKNKVTNKTYIGRKQMTSKRKLKPLKGKTRKRTQIKESDWRTYSGSSNELVADKEKYGAENLEHLILKFTSCKWDAAYEELKEQILRDVIWKPEEFYNGILNIRLSRPPAHLIEARKLRETK